MHKVWKAIPCALLLLLLAGRVDAQLPPNAQVVEYPSPAVDLRMKYTVLLPEGYAHGERRYPVLYLLHGHTGNHTSWLTYAGLPADAATRLGAIVVLADGGNGFYTDWRGALGPRPQRWEDAIVEDLVAEVDRRWRTRPAREHRAIGGMSMGGYGAVAIALRHPDKFAFAFSSAGALRFAQRIAEELRSGQEDWNRPTLWSTDERPPVAIAGFSTQAERTPRGRVFTSVGQAEEADPFVLARRMPVERAPYLHLDYGLQDSLGPETEAFATVLKERGIPYSLVVLPGDHEAPYWTHAFEHALLVLRGHLQRAAPGE